MAGAATKRHAVKKAPLFTKRINEPLSLVSYAALLVADPSGPQFRHSGRSGGLHRVKAQQWM